MSTAKKQEQQRPAQCKDVALAPALSFIDGRWVEGPDRFPVLDKYSGQVFAEVFAVSAEQVRQAVQAARKAFEAGAPPPHLRAAALYKCAELLGKYKSRFIDHMVAEAGLTLHDASGDVDRSIITLRLSAEEATRLIGEQVSFGASPGQHNRIGFTIRVPLGIVCAITPFNSPLNTVVHKVAPSLAAGNAVVLKPSGYTPLTSALLVETLLEAGVPPGFLSLIQGGGAAVGNVLLEQPEIDFYAFTGSTRVGAVIQRAAGFRKCQLEMGSIASTIVCDDADLTKALPKIAHSSFRKAGQVCTSIQRLYVQVNVLEDIVKGLAHEASRMTAGDPRDPATLVGPLISEPDAKRVESWIHEAVVAGAELICGGQRSGSVIQPTVLTNVAPGMKVWDTEIFGPVVCVMPFREIEEAIESANSQPYGLAAGVFTRDINKAVQAARSLRFGAVHINETSSSRADGMPFGGVKASGYGFEGPKYTIREVTEERLITINL
jgi:succinate-semialdehyde dehydrogenase/glutarate-semialdehyde dehydrogenase